MTSYTTGKNMFCDPHLFNNPEKCITQQMPDGRIYKQLILTPQENETLETGYNHIYNHRQRHHDEKNKKIAQQLQMQANPFNPFHQNASPIYR